MSGRGQALCAWSGPLALVFFGAAVVSAHFLPPPLPSATADDVAAMYQAHLTGIRVGALLLLFSPSLMTAFTAAITAQMKRTEGALSPLAYTQLAAGTMALVPLVVTGLVWTVAAFRPERVPELTQALNDLGWIFFVMPAPPAIVQLLALGLWILHDKTPAPAFPRWAAFFNIWVAILFLPGCLIGMFKFGPFAWNGIFAFWMPAIVFGTWIFVMCGVLLKAGKRQVP